MPETKSIPSAPGVLAAIDMGSNSFRLEIAQLEQGRYRRIAYLKETVRLGAGLDANKLLTEVAAQRGLDCLQRFALRLDGFAPHQVRAVATQTLREARNRDAFLERARTVLGYPVEVISGREEARLIYAGVARLQPSDHARLVIDIGGRSTEMILGQGRKPITAESFQVGSVSLSMRFFPDGKFSAAAFRAAQVACGAELEEALQPFSRGLWREALGSSGTVGAVSQVLAASGITDGRITPEALRWCIEQCLAAGHVDRIKLAGLKEDRRAVVAGGLCILYTLVMQFGIEELLPAKGALRQGVIFDLAERLETVQRGPKARASDIREPSVKALQQRFDVDLAQAKRVQQQALALYKQLAPEAAPESRRELGWAAALHEIGMMVSHHDHHRHSAYLLAHVDAPGFSQSQLRLISDLVLGQRGGLKKLDTRLTDTGFLWQLLSLRLAVIKAHARDRLDKSAMQLRHRDQAVELQMAPGWAAAHPRTVYLLQEELQAWARSGLLELTLKA
nr:exopolyphosphatase [uncultured Roseateles sp.]